MSELLDFVNSAKHTNKHLKFQFNKVRNAIFPPDGILIQHFWLSLIFLILSILTRNHLLLFANLLYLGFMAALILKSDMQQVERLLYPVCMIPAINLLCILQNGLGRLKTSA